MQGRPPPQLPRGPAPPSMAPPKQSPPGELARRVPGSTVTGQRLPPRGPPPGSRAGPVSSIAPPRGPPSQPGIARPPGPAHLRSNCNRHLGCNNKFCPQALRFQYLRGDPYHQEGPCPRQVEAHHLHSVCRLVVSDRHLVASDRHQVGDLPRAGNSDRHQVGDLPRAGNSDRHQVGDLPQVGNSDRHQVGAGNSDRHQVEDRPPKLVGDQHHLGHHRKPVLLGHPLVQDHRRRVNLPSVDHRSGARPPAPGQAPQQRRPPPSGPRPPAPGQSRAPPPGARPPAPGQSRAPPPGQPRGPGDRRPPPQQAGRAPPPQQAGRAPPPQQAGRAPPAATPGRAPPPGAAPGRAPPPGAAPGRAPPPGCSYRAPPPGMPLVCLLVGNLLQGKMMRALFRPKEHHQDDQYHQESRLLLVHSHLVQNRQRMTSPALLMRRCHLKMKTWMCHLLQWVLHRRKMMMKKERHHPPPPPDEDGPPPPPPPPPPEKILSHHLLGVCVLSYWRHAM